MTSPEDNQRDDPAQGKPDDEPTSGLPLDEDAAWRLIVENYGDRPEMGDSSGTAAPAEEDPAEGLTASSTGTATPSAFDRSYLDAVDAGRAEEARDVEPPHEDEHFIPPDPPPVPRGTPARRLAWAGLFGAPLVMLASVVFGWAFPAVLSMALVAAFVGGFVFLVATMPRDGGDGWDDGAVV